MVDAVCEQVLVVASTAIFGNSAAGTFFVIVWGFGYYLIFEGLFAGKTPGKWITHTRVVVRDTRYVALGAALFTAARPQTEIGAYSEVAPPNYPRSLD